MNMTDAYDYDALAYALYREADDLIEKLVAIRDARGMSVADLAEEMNVDAATIVGVEDGSIEPTLQLLVDYALETGAIFHIQVKKAEAAKISSQSFHKWTTSAVCAAEWDNGDKALVATSVPVNDQGEAPVKMHVMGAESRYSFTVPTAHNLNTTEATTC